MFNLTAEVELWPLSVDLDSAAAAYYAHDVGLPVHYNYSMYNESLIDVDQDQCATACMSSGWCKSFDYYMHASLCLLSYFTASQIGGLSTVSTHPLSVSHYEYDKDRWGLSEIVSPSSVLNSGLIRIASSTICSSVAIEATMVMDNSSTIVISDGAVLSLAQGGTSTASAQFDLCNATVVFETEPFNMSASTVVNSDCGVGNSAVVYEGGHHVPSCDLRNVSIVARSGAYIVFDDVSEASMNNVEISESSTISWSDSASAVVDSLSLTDGAMLLVSNIAITARHIIIDNTSAISSSGNGYEQSSGPGAGVDHDLGASGGAHGGRGGSAMADAVTSPYGSASWPTDMGSGGGRGGFEGTGGRGGGSIMLHCSVLDVDGYISSDGLTGIAGGGGGSGGSVAINATEVRGSGAITALGGTGGFSGGLVAGGGGSGGRVAVHVASDFEYEGCFNVAGGYRPETYDISVEMAASGSTFFSLESIEVRALVFSANTYCNFSSNLVDRSEVSDVDAIYDMHRSSTVLDNSTSLGLFDLHVVGNIPVLFSSGDNQAQALNISAVVVSPANTGTASLTVSAMTELTFPENNLFLKELKLHIFNTSLASKHSVTIGNNAQLILYSWNISTVFDFELLSVQDNGIVKFQNKSISISGTELILQNESAVVLCEEDVEIAFQDITAHNSIFYGRGGQDCDMLSDATLQSAPVMTFSGSHYNFVIVDSVILSDVKVVNNGFFNISSAYVDVQGASSFLNNGVVSAKGSVSIINSDVSPQDFDSSIFSCVSPTASYYTSSYPSQIVQSATGLFLTEMNSSVSITVAFDLEGRLQVGSGDVSIRAGGSCIDCEIDVMTGGTLVFQGSTVFTFTEMNSYLKGQGMLLVEGIVRYPTAVNSTPPTTIADGCLLLDNAETYSVEALTVTNHGSVYLNNTMTEINKLDIVYGGSVFVHNAVNIDTLLVDFGTFECGAVNCTIGDKLNFTAGFLSGNGNIVLTPTANMYFTSDDNTTTSTYVLVASLMNFGTLHVLQQSVYWGRAGTFFNYGLVDFISPVSYQWLPAGEIYSFVRLENTEMTRWEGLWEVVSNSSTTQVSCAAECLNTDWTVSRKGGFGKHFMDDTECRSFSFNAELRACRIHMVSSQTPGSTVDDNARGEFAWDVYSRISSWVGKYSFANMESGSVHQHVPSSTVALNTSFENRGLISVTEGASLSLDGVYTLAAGGINRVNGTLELKEGGGSIQEEIAGGGAVIFAGGSHLLEYSLQFETFPVTLMDGAEMTVASDIFHLSGSSLTLDGGSTVLFMGRMGLNIATLTIQGGSTIKSHSSVVDSFPAGFSANEAEVSGDINLNATRLLILGNSSSLEMSAGRIRAENIGISYNASLSCAGRGYNLDNVPVSTELWVGEYDMVGSTGGSHGGVGGASRNLAALNTSGGYGSLFDPMTWGSPGGGLTSSVNFSASTSSGGGGAMLISVTNNLVVNGTIDCGGLSPEGNLHGGGAGGSLLLRVKSLSGSGNIFAKGGDGGYISTDLYGRGGGGGGGRIAVYYEFIDGFSGSVKASGGSGYDGLSGSAGTLYWKYTGALLESSDGGGDLIIDNDGGDSGDASTFLLNHNSPHGVYNSITIKGKSRLNIQTNGFPVATTSLIGDNSGSVLLTNGTVLKGLNSTTSAGKLSIEALSVNVRDAMIDAPDIDILQEGYLYLSELGNTAGNPTASYTLDTLNVFNGGELIVHYQDKALCSLNESVVKLSIRNITVFAGGSIHADGQGFSGVVSAALYESSKEESSGVGYGTMGAAGGGGGGHGGYGGDGFKGIGGVPYDSFVYPQLCGSGGGGGNSRISLSGGEGGGVLHITSTVITVDGRLSADGIAGDGSGGGGGAGGSIVVVTELLNGTGIISTQGGDGTFNARAYGGGGSGGRISLRIKNDTTFSGQIVADGGVSVLSSYVDAERSFLRDMDTSLLEWLRQASVQRAASGTVFYQVGPDNSISTKLVLDNSYTFELNLTYSAAISHTRNISLQDSIHLASQTDAVFSEVFGMSSAYSDVCETSPVVEINELTIFNSAALMVCNFSTLILTSSLSLDSTVEIYLPASTTFMLTNATFSLSSGLLRLHGNMFSSPEVSLRDGAQVLFYPSASWLENDNMMAIDAGMFNVSRVMLYDSSGIVFYGTNVTDAVQYPMQYMYCSELWLVGTSSFISADGQGYPGSSVYVGQHSTNVFQAIGNVTYGNGGFHAGSGGGLGMNTSTSFYGSAYEPDRYGAGGGSTYQHRGGAGGGALRIVVQSELIVDGMISARGESCSSGNLTGSGAGGGGGGSIWINVIEGNLTGSGELSAAGGNGCIGGGGGGSGGRIAVYDAGAMSAFEGSVRVNGGWQTEVSNGTDSNLFAMLPSGGTLYVARSDGQDAGILVADNSGNVGSDVFATGHELSYSARSRYLDQIVIGEPCTLSFEGMSKTIVSDVVSFTNTKPYIRSFFSSSAEHFGKLKLTSGAELYVNGNLFLNRFDMEMGSATLLIRRNTTVGENTTFTVTWNSSDVASLQESLLTFPPTSLPSSEPSSQPSSIPSSIPTFTVYPTLLPTGNPTNLPSGQPSNEPTGSPTQFGIPTSKPSSDPSSVPSYVPSSTPSSQPSIRPSGEPSSQPSTVPTTSSLTNYPTNVPSFIPSFPPSGRPSSAPTFVPTPLISPYPTNSPTLLSNNSGRLTFNSIVIMRGGKFVVGESSKFYASSFQISAEHMDIQRGASLMSNAVILPTSDLWTTTAATDNINLPVAYGFVSNGRSGGGGGGHSGHGTTGSSMSSSGQARGFAVEPLGGGGPGGSGPTGRGGAGGGGLHIVVEGDMSLNGTVSVAGGSADMSSGAGGGAGGSLFLQVGGHLSGNGEIIADGGHGSISNEAVLYGGGGAGGRVKVASCSSSFSGSVSALGGLSLAPLSVASESTTGIFKALQNLAENVFDSLGLRAGAAGTIIQSEGICGDDDLIFSQTLEVSSWSDIDLITKVPTAFLDSLNSSGISTASIKTETSYFTFDEADGGSHDNETVFEYVSVTNAEAKLQFEGTGLVTSQSLITDESTSISIGTDASLDISGELDISGINLILLGTLSTEDPVPRNLTLRDGAYLYLGKDAKQSVNAVVSSRFEFHNVLINNATLKGPVINITAKNVDLENNALVTSAGLGHDGCEAGVSDAVGEGAGYQGSRGGGGGGHGGKGMSGLSARYIDTENDRKLGLGVSLSLDSVASGGISHGSYEWPRDYGSGGGCSSGPLGGGGSGGGVIWIHARDFFTMNYSTITANGESVYGGGGGGAGGSIVLKCFYMYGGDDWTNKITANGGDTCLPVEGEEYCDISVEYPGGKGAGGRIAIHGNIHAYVSTLEALPSGLMYSNSSDKFLQQHMGTIRYTRPHASLLYGKDVVDRDENNNERFIEYVEVVYNEPPVLQVESIVVTSASGSVVYGHFVLAYKYSRTSQLDASSSAEEVRSALAELPGLSTVSVNRKVSPTGGGYTWDITFHHSNTIASQVTMFRKTFYTLDNAKVSTSIFTYEDAYRNYENPPLESRYSDFGPAPYNYSTLISYFDISFSADILNESSFAYQVDERTLRIYQDISKYNSTDILSLVDSLMLESFRSNPTRFGLLGMGTDHLPMKSMYDANAEAPTGQPTGTPTSPTGQPTDQPTDQPSGQPSVQPSGQPTDQPTDQPTGQPSSQPSSQPTLQPSAQPSGQPSGQPSSQPSGQPTTGPSGQPSAQPTSEPSGQPSNEPSGQPSGQPSGEPSGIPTVKPTGQPSSQPTGEPSGQPSCVPSAQPSSVPTSPTGEPSSMPTSPSGEPSGQPTKQPSGQPSGQPTVASTSQPSSEPTSAPTSPTAQPSGQPSGQPTGTPSSPSGEPTAQPSGQPSEDPSGQPSGQPSSGPTGRPSGTPSLSPTAEPSGVPSTGPTGEPSGQPSGEPSSCPTALPTISPSSQPSSGPTGEPTDQPTAAPSGLPSAQPSVEPTCCPSGEPTGQPSTSPSSEPSCQPTKQPTTGPSSQPTAQPSCCPSGEPTGQPTANPSTAPSIQSTGRPSSDPSKQPSGEPTGQPTGSPSGLPTLQPTGQPSSDPSTKPSNEPTGQPTGNPSGVPSLQPTGQPSSDPSTKPSSEPTGQPTGSPSGLPTLQPTGQPSSDPSTKPSSEPTGQPTGNPSGVPSLQPTGQPSSDPSAQPSITPSANPSGEPSGLPSTLPSTQPSAEPSSCPSVEPSGQPSTEPSGRPTNDPSSQPSAEPSPPS